MANVNHPCFRQPDKKHLLKVVNALYPGKYFMNYNDVWSKIKVNIT